MTRLLVPLLLLVIPVQAAASPVVVAILDSGVDASHPALAGRIVDGYDLWYGDADPDDRCGHGTNLAGIVAQLAPDAQIMPIKVMADEWLWHLQPDGGRQLSWLSRQGRTSC